MDRKEAITLSAIMRENAIDDPDYESISKRLRLLELRLQQAGIDTQFSRGSYRSALRARIGRLESDDE
ncbi:DnaJ family domain-containing protein [Lonsdalea quercina]